MLFICFAICLHFLCVHPFIVTIWKAYFPSLNFSGSYLDCIHFRRLCILDYLLILREKTFIIVMCFMKKHFYMFIFFLFFFQNLVCITCLLSFCTCCFFLKLTMHKEIMLQRTPVEWVRYLSSLNSEPLSWHISQLLIVLEFCLFSGLA